jgi:SAM-dependent methyltransferase
VNILGVDLTDSYIRTARRRAEQERLPCEFHIGDAFEFIAPRACDAAINWFTSFSYSQDDQANLRQLKNIFASLKPGGRFLLDFMNIPGVMANFRQAVIDRPKCPELVGVVVLHENSADFLAGMMESDWTFIYPDGRRVGHHISTRMYMPHEIARMLRACGFNDIQLFGSAEGEPLDRTSKRCIAFARKPS